MEKMEKRAMYVMNCKKKMMMEMTLTSLKLIELVAAMAASDFVMEEEMVMVAVIMATVSYFYLKVCLKKDFNS